MYRYDQEDKAELKRWIEEEKEPNYGNVWHEMGRGWVREGSGERSRKDIGKGKEGNSERMEIGGGELYVRAWERKRSESKGEEFRMKYYLFYKGDSKGRGKFWDRHTGAGER